MLTVLRSSLTVFVVCTLPGSTSFAQVSRTVDATVGSVVAGDVLTIQVPAEGGEAETVTIRLVEVTAPRNTQPMADEATALTRSLLPEGSKVTVKLYGDQTKNSKMENPAPASVRTKDGTDVGTELILEGLAWWDWNDAQLTPREDSDELAVIELDAKIAGVGVFAHSNPIVPSNYRLGARVRLCRQLSSLTVDGEIQPALQSSDCVIVAMVPNPRGTDVGRESIVLGNRTQEKLTLEGWHIHDNDGGVFALAGSIDAGATRSIVLDENLQLGNSGDTVWLTAPTKRIAHAAQYYSARSGQFVTVP